MPRFKLLPVDESFFESAPERYEATFDIPRPAADVWADITADDALHWCRILKTVTWTSQRPFGVGTTRSIAALGGALKMDENFFRWEEGRRKSFMGLQASLPLFRRIAEDYLVEPTSDTSCRFTWVIAIEAPPLMKPGAPINKQLMNSLFKDTRKHYGLS